MSKVWFVTGASSGLGRCIAQRAASRGYCVVATARRAADLADLVEPAPDRVAAVELDVTNMHGIRTAVHAAVERFGRVDVLVNNAGYGLVGALEECGQGQIERCLATNFTGPMYLMRALLPVMRRQGGGTIVNVSAAAAIANYAGFSVYGAAKSALESLSEAVALEGEPLGVRVMIVQPGPFRTAFIARSLDRAEYHLPAYDGTSGRFARMLAGMDGKQPGDPARAAEAVVSVVEREGKIPRRLVLGRYAVGKARAAAAARVAELGEWELVGLGTEFSARTEGGAPAQAGAAADRQGTIP